MKTEITAMCKIIAVYTLSFVFFVTVYKLLSIHLGFPFHWVFPLVAWDIMTVLIDHIPKRRRKKYGRKETK